VHSFCDDCIQAQKEHGMQTGDMQETTLGLQQKTKSSSAALAPRQPDAPEYVHASGHKQASARGSISND
jgi:hypothetical protein